MWLAFTGYYAIEKVVHQYGDQKWCDVTWKRWKFSVFQLRFLCSYRGLWHSFHHRGIRCLAGKMDWECSFWGSLSISLSAEENSSWLSRGNLCHFPCSHLRHFVRWRDQVMRPLARKTLKDFLRQARQTIQRHLAMHLALFSRHSPGSKWWTWLW